MEVEKSKIGYGIPNQRLGDRWAVPDESEMLACPKERRRHNDIRSRKGNWPLHFQRFERIHLLLEQSPHQYDPNVIQVSPVFLTGTGGTS